MTFRSHQAQQQHTHWAGTCCARGGCRPGLSAPRRGWCRVMWAAAVTVCCQLVSSIDATASSLNGVMVPTKQFHPYEHRLTAQHTPYRQSLADSCRFELAAQAQSPPDSSTFVRPVRTTQLSTSTTNTHATPPKTPLNRLLATPARHSRTCLRPRTEDVYPTCLCSHWPNACYYLLAIAVLEQCNRLHVHYISQAHKICTKSSYICM